MIEAKLHTASIAGTLLTAVGVCIGVYFADEAQGSTAADDDPYKNMVVIDAALAEKSSSEEKQPQKEFKPPPDPVKPIGVSHDENAKPVAEPDKPKPPPTPNIDDILKKNRATDDDDDLPVGKPKIETGRIDGVEVGFGDKTFGNTYLGALKSTFLKLWDFPEILDDTGTPVGCIELQADGSIKSTKLMTQSGNPQLDDSVERALAAFMAKNNEDPKPLPKTPDDLSYLARMPLCWRLKV